MSPMTGYKPYSEALAAGNDLEAKRWFADIVRRFRGFDLDRMEVDEEFLAIENYHGGDVRLWLKPAREFMLLAEQERRSDKDFDAIWATATLGLAIARPHVDKPYATIHIPKRKVKTDADIYIVSCTNPTRFVSINMDDVRDAPTVRKSNRLMADEDFVEVSMLAASLWTVDYDATTISLLRPAMDYRPWIDLMRRHQPRRPR